MRRRGKDISKMNNIEVKKTYFFYFSLYFPKYKPPLDYYIFQVRKIDKSSYN